MRGGFAQLGLGYGAGGLAARADVQGQIAGGWSVFGDGSWSPSAGLNAIGGVRFTW